MTDDATGDVLVSTAFELPGYAVERTVGVAWGLIVRSVGVAKGLTGGLRSLRSGEVDEYTALVDSARRTALDRGSSKWSTAMIVVALGAVIASRTGTANQAFVRR
jgi:Putative heavy-metal-binding